jgi:hypothetical protein
MAELGIALIREMIETFFSERASEQKRWIFLILHNLVTLTPRKEFAELAPPATLEIYLDYFMLMEGMKDERLLQSLAIYILSPGCSVVRFEFSGGLFGRYCRTASSKSTAGGEFDWRG